MYVLDHSNPVSLHRPENLPSYIFFHSFCPQLFLKKHYMNEMVRISKWSYYWPRFKACDPNTTKRTYSPGIISINFMYFQLIYSKCSYSQLIYVGLVCMYSLFISYRELRNPSTKNYKLCFTHSLVSERYNPGLMRNLNVCICDIYNGNGHSMKNIYHEQLTCPFIWHSRFLPILFSSPILSAWVELPHGCCDGKSTIWVHGWYTARKRPSSTWNVWQRPIHRRSDGIQSRLWSAQRRLLLWSRSVYWRYYFLLLANDPWGWSRVWYHFWQWWL